MTEVFAIILASVSLVGMLGVAYGLLRLTQMLSKLSRSIVKLERSVSEIESNLKSQEQAITKLQTTPKALPLPTSIGAGVSQLVGASLSGSKIPPIAIRFIELAAVQLIGLLMKKRGKKKA